MGALLVATSGPAMAQDEILFDEDGNVWLCRWVGDDFDLVWELVCVKADVSDFVNTNFVDTNFVDSDLVFADEVSVGFEEGFDLGEEAAEADFEEDEEDFGVLFEDDDDNGDDDYHGVDV